MKKEKEQQPLERYSFSKLSSFNTCAANYFYTYILKEDQIENALSQYGTFIHKILERWAKGELEIFELLNEYIKGFDSNVTCKFPTLRNGKSMKDGHYKDGLNFFTTFDGVGDYKILTSEDKFEIQVNDFIFNGIIDLVLQDANGNLIILDWKSKGGFSDENEESKYRRQLYLYSYYVKQKYGKYPKETIFYCFRKSEKFAREFDMNAYQESLDWMNNTVAGIRKFRCGYDFFFCNTLCSNRAFCQIKKERENKKSNVEKQETESE